MSRPCDFYQIQEINQQSWAVGKQSQTRHRLRLSRRWFGHVKLGSKGSKKTLIVGETAQSWLWDALGSQRKLLNFKEKDSFVWGSGSQIPIIH